jgi:enamine deaminase RidA (YjgF/YER057c/UK114 family)
METGSIRKPAIGEISGTPSAESRVKVLGLILPKPPEPLGIYVEAVQVGSLLFLTGMLPIEGGQAAFVGRVGVEIDAATARDAARLAALNALALVRSFLGSLDRVKRVVRLGVSVAAVGDVRDHPKVADGASELLQDVFGRERNPCRLVVGVASLPLGTPVELELIMEVTDDDQDQR